MEHSTLGFEDAFEELEPLEVESDLRETLTANLRHEVALRRTGIPPVFVLASLEYAYPSVPPGDPVCAVDKPRASLRAGTVRRPYRGCDGLSQLSHLT